MSGNRNTHPVGRPDPLFQASLFPFLSSPPPSHLVFCHHEPLFHSSRANPLFSGQGPHRPPNSQGREAGKARFNARLAPSRPLGRCNRQADAGTLVRPASITEFALHFTRASRFPWVHIISPHFLARLYLHLHMYAADLDPQISTTGLHSGIIPLRYKTYATTATCNRMRLTRAQVQGRRGRA